MSESFFCPRCLRTLNSKTAYCPMDGLKLTPIPKELPGLGVTIDKKYTILEEIGYGGMGCIFKAFDSKMRREVALKVLMPQFVASENSVRRFFIEARAAKYLYHPNIVDLYDFGCTIEGYLFIAMELLRGETVADLIMKDSKIPVIRTLRILYGITEALCLAHKKGVIHRDLKPENIMLLPWDGNGDFVKVLDFGIAAVLDRSMENNLNFGEVIGTPCYMSPEQIKGIAVDGRSDIYALGNLLFEMLSGDTPFLGNTPHDTMKMHLYDEVPELPVLDICYEAREKITILLRDMLSKDPDKRPESVDALKLRIRHLMEIVDDYKIEIKEKENDSRFVPFHERHTIQVSDGIYSFNSQPTLSIHGENGLLDREKTLLQFPQSDVPTLLAYKVCPNCQKINHINNLKCEKCKYSLGVNIGGAKRSTFKNEQHLVNNRIDKSENSSNNSNGINKQKHHTPWTIETEELSYLKVISQDFLTLSLLHVKLDFGHGEKEEELDSIRQMFEPEIEAWSDLVVARSGIICFDTSEEIRCLFGLHGKNGGSTKDSIRCAFDIKKRAQNFKRILKKALTIKIGIATSMVPKINVLMGSPDISIRGSGVDLATRLVHIAPSDSIIADEESARLTCHQFNFSRYNTIKVRGKDKPITIYAAA